MATGDAPFGALLRRHRTANGLTQEELAERAGVSPRAVSALERGVRRTPHRGTAEQLAGALGLSGEEQQRFLATARRSPATGSTPPLSTAAASTPFVGRSAEYHRLEQHLAAAGPPVAMLVGEPGIGKSRLLTEIIPAATGLGMTVLQGGCQRRRGEEPYTPLLEALARHISALSPSSRRAALDGCTWLVRLLPELGDEVPALEPGQERRLVYAAVSRFLANVAGPGGTLLLLDDLQWASTDALDLLTSLVQFARQSPLHVVGAYRDTEVRPDDALSVTLTDLAHAHLVTRIPVGPLSPEAAAQLLDGLLPDLPRTEAERRVLTRAGGVPFFLVSCGQELRSGSLDGSVQDVPWDVAQSIRQRVAGLPAEARDVLGAAAVIGRTVPVALLLSVATQPEDVVLDALDVACDARLLEESGPRDYRFSHDVIREVVDVDLGAGRRAVLHRRAAQALERLPGMGSVEAVAYHYERSGDLERAAVWAERAGDRAASMYANAEAVSQYERARRFFEEIDAPVQVLAQLDEKTGAPLYMSGQYGRAIEILERALAIYRGLADDEKVRSVSARIGKTYFESGHPIEGLRHVQPLLDDPAESPGMAHLLVALSHLLWRSIRYRESLQAAERSALLAERFADTRTLAEAETRRGSALWKLGNWREGRAALERAAVLAERVGDLETTSRTLSNLGELHMVRGDLAEARRCLDRSLDSMERRKGPSGIVYMNTLFGRLMFAGGHWEEARARLTGAVEMTQTFVHGWVSIYPRLELARLDLAEGRWDRLLTELDECRRRAEQNSDPQALEMVEALLAELDLAEGRPAEARDRLESIVARPTEDVYRDLAIVTFLVDADVALGRAEEAQRLAEGAIARAEKYGDRLHLVDLLRAQGVAQDALGRHQEAQAVLDRSLELAREVGTPYGEGRALYTLGMMHHARGETDSARNCLADAGRIFNRLGANPYVPAEESLQS